MTLRFKCLRNPRKLSEAVAQALQRLRVHAVVLQWELATARMIATATVRMTRKHCAGSWRNFELSENTSSAFETRWQPPSRLRRQKMRPPRATRCSQGPSQQQVETPASSKEAVVVALAGRCAGMRMLCSVIKCAAPQCTLDVDSSTTRCATTSTVGLWPSSFSDSE